VTTLVLGVGNLLLTDDGAGVHAARRFQQLACADGLQVLDAGTLSFTLAPLVGAAHRLLIFDAAELHLPAGEVRCFTDSAIDAFLARARPSVHEIGLRDLMDIARLQDSLPEERALIAIQPVTIDWGTSLTPPVDAGVDRAVDLALEWLHAPIARRHEPARRRA
jgi:hydrogenase maturation protease